MVVATLNKEKAKLRQRHILDTADEGEGSEKVAMPSVS